MKGYWHLLFVGFAGTALAGPTPPPPDDFAGAQYIDGQGCVFTRNGVHWLPRPDPTGGQLCGFPPSLEVRRTDPGTVDVLPPAHPVAPPDPAALLAERLAEELRRADMDGDVLPAVELPQRRQNPMLAELTTMVNASGAVTSSLAAVAGAPTDVCARMGYRAEPLPGGQRDPSGLCPGLRPATPEARHAAAPSQRVAAATTGAPAAATPPAVTRPAKARPAPARSAPRPAAAGQAAAAPTRARTPTADGPEMIPASARFVQIGNFADPAAAEAAIRALTSRGMPAARGRSGGRIAVMAGPFADRRSLIAALNQLRRNGWPGATAR